MGPLPQVRRFAFFSRLFDPARFQLNAKKIYLSTFLVLLTCFVTLLNAQIQTKPSPPEGLIAYWPLDGNLQSQAGPKTLTARGSSTTAFTDSPFGKALVIDGKSGPVVVPPDDSLRFGTGEFTLSAWIHPTQWRQAGIFCHGGYSYTHGWLLDMPGPDGRLRLETSNPQNQPNGTVQSNPGVLRLNQWSHIAAVVRRGDKVTRLFVNGFEVARGTVAPAILDNPKASLNIGSINGSFPFPGLIDEVQIFNRALTEADLQVLIEPGRRFAQKPVEQPTPRDGTPSIERFSQLFKPAHPRQTKWNPDCAFFLESDDVVVFVGQTDMVRSAKEATLESLLAMHYAKSQPRFRNMAWEGDTVFEQWRDINFGSWPDQLKGVSASVIFAQFGQAEILKLEKQAKIQGIPIDQISPAPILAAYEKLLKEWTPITQRLVLIGPHYFEKSDSPYVPDHRNLNPLVDQVSTRIAKLAQDRGFLFVDLTRVLPRDSVASLTVNGIHIKDPFHQSVAVEIAKQLGIKGDPNRINPNLLQAIRHKNQLWFDNWRPMNWSFAFGDRTEQPFGKPGGEKPALRVELEEFKPLIDAADRTVHQIALGESPKPLETVNPKTDAKASPNSLKPPVDHSVTAELASFTVADGFQINLFASESDGIVKPLQMRWDDRGRLWVICAPTYPHIEPGASPRDYILVCEDTDGDGKADKFHRFAEGLFMPEGIEFGNGGVYVCEGTELVHLKDTDGDGKADSRTVILSGFGTADSHQMINGIGWGPGGELWFSQGHHVYSHIETPFGISKLHKAGVWRLRPRTGQLHGFFNESTAGLNCQGVTYDPWGQIFHNSGAWSGGFYTVPGMIPTLRPVKYMSLAVPDRRNTGIEFIHTNHMPDNLQGALVWGGFMSNSIQLHQLVDEGSGYNARVLPDLVKSSRFEFRPVNVRVGPDGGIYVCDWYNAVIGHYQASYRDPSRDRTHGRIWRITAKDRPLSKQPDLANMPIPKILDLLRCPEGLTRYNAKRKLFDLPTLQVIPATEEWISQLEIQDPKREQLLLEAIGIFEAHEIVRPELLQKLIQATDPRVRAYAARVVGHWWSRLDQPLTLLRHLIQDEHPRVRLEAIVVCSHIPSTRSMEIAAMAVDRPRDRYIDYALHQCVDALKPYWYPALSRGELRFDGQLERLRFVLESDGTKDVTGQIRRLAGNAQLSPDAREKLLALLVTFGNPDDLAFALKQSSQSTIVLGELLTVATVHKKKPSGDLGPTVRSLLTDSNQDLKALGIRLAGAWQMRDLAAEIQKLIASRETPEKVFIASLGSLAQLRGAESQSIIAPFAGLSSPPTIQVAAIQALAESDIKLAGKMAAPLIAQSQDESLTTQLMAPFLNRRQGCDLLAAELTGLSKTDSPLKSDPAKLAHRVLSAAGRSDESLLKVINSALGTKDSLTEYDPSYVAQLAREVIQKGNARRGGEMFQSRLANCAACHKLHGKGGELGPDLSIIGAGRSPELLIESVIWPNRQIREGYMSIQVATEDGRIYKGYRLKDTPEELHLLDTATQQVRRIAKKQIEEIKDAGSIMPAGLTGGMTREELRDLIRFLVEQGKTQETKKEK